MRCATARCARPSWRRAPALSAACAAAGLGDWLVAPAPLPWSPLQLLQAIARWPADRPLLLAPGVLHANAWLLAAAVALRRRVWVYVPMTYTAVMLGYKAGWLRDRALAPWLRCIDAWITPDERQAALLRGCWRVVAPVHALPNLARVAGAPPAAPATAADGRLRVACVGRYELRQKGLDWLAGLLLGDPAWTEHFQWRFQGRGPGELALLEMASTLGPQHVQVRGWAPLDDALAASDVLLLPSRFEGVPLVALEATARGWPVVASHDSNLGDILPAGSLFDFGNAFGLRRALDGLRQPTARMAAVAHARARVDALDTGQRYRTALQRIAASLSGQAAPKVSS